MNWGRISGVMLRHSYLYKRSLPRLMDLFFWPMMDLIVWGFVSIYLMGTGNDVPRFVGFFLGALILWDLLYRANLGVAVLFLEEVWTKNLLNLFASPLKSSELLAGMILSSFLRALIGVAFMAGIAALFYHFNVFTLGLPLVAFLFNVLLMGWSLGIVSTAIILRFGQSAEMLAWAFAVLFQPFSAVFYPVAVLPPILQTMAHFVPSSYVFEGMREVISTGVFSTHDFLAALGLNVIYAVAAIVLFGFFFSNARRSGRLARAWQ